MCDTHHVPMFLCTSHIYQHFQDCKKVHEIDPHVPIENIDNTIYPHINKDIEYSLFENVIDSYYLDSQIGDGFTCNKACYAHNDDNNILETRPQCTHTYDHILQQLSSITDTAQQHQVYTSKVDASLFTSDTFTPCEFNIVPDITETETEKPIEEVPQNNTSIHFHSNINIEILLEMHTCSIMTLTMVMDSLTMIWIHLQ